MAKKGETVRLSVNSCDIISSQGLDSFNKGLYCMEKISQQNCEARLMKRENGAFLIRETDEVGYFVNLRTKSIANS